MITLSGVLLLLGWGLFAAEIAFIYLVPHWMPSRKSGLRVKYAGGGCCLLAITLFVLCGVIHT